MLASHTFGFVTLDGKTLDTSYFPHPLEGLTIRLIKFSR